MKCRKCGTEFDEGIFCPECGEKNGTFSVSESSDTVSNVILKKQEDNIKKDKEIFQLEKELREQEKKIEQQKNENLRIENEAKNAQLKLENEQREREKESHIRRTYAGVTYRTEDEAITAREDNEKINLLKERLLNTRNQKKRKEIFDSFNDVIINPVAKQRLEFLREKVNKKMPIGVLLGWVFDAITVAGGIILFILVCICACVAPEADFSIVIMGIWMLFAIFTTPIAVIWTIISIIIMTRKSYYKRIKHI